MKALTSVRNLFEIDFYQNRFQFNILPLKSG